MKKNRKFPDSARIAAAVTRQRALVEQLFQELLDLSHDPEGGVTRAPYSPEETRIHQRVGAIAGTLGLEVTRDAMANTYMTLPGRDPAAQKILTGSHLDSVRQGGNFDGAAGVVAGLAVCAALKDLGIQPRRDISVMGVRAEESAWFGISYIGSRGALGVLPDGALGARRVDAGLTLADGIRAAGGDPDAVAARRKTFEPTDLHCFLELHIEQGPLLDRDGLPAGIVTAIPGNFRFPDAHVLGEYGHVGLLKDWRRDAVTAASEFAVAMDALWADWEGDGKPMACTIGQFNTDPELHAMTKVAGELRFTLDVRAYDAVHLKELEAKTLAIIRSVEERRGVRFELGATARAAVGEMAPVICDDLAAIARELAIPVRRLGSPASHDSAAFAAAGVPTAMIFVRNAHVSHNPAEAMAIDDFLQAAAIMATWIAAAAQ